MRSAKIIKSTPQTLAAQEAYSAGWNAAIDMCAEMLDRVSRDALKTFARFRKENPAAAAAFSAAAFRVRDQILSRRLRKEVKP